MANDADNLIGLVVPGRSSSDAVDGNRRRIVEFIVFLFQQWPRKVRADWNERNGWLNRAGGTVRTAQSANATASRMTRS
jgi:hypothetical protein